MKVMILCGSGHAGGSTERMCQVFSEVMDSHGVASDIVRLSDLNILDYTGDHEYDDDMESLCRNMESTDLLVFSTPIYFNGCSSILKRFIDRLNPYWGSDRPHPKYACAMMCGGSPQCEFSHARSEIKSAVNTVGMEWLGDMCLPGTDKGEIDEAKIREFAD
ncbi:MAG: NAD(P)H-dependent oxidoreductase, partial [Candidatus Methanomethylophilus sp.]|nr:NAD(P)H-dependent oxidoreductase [Methanomethylophilus sp.]